MVPSSPDLRVLHGLRLRGLVDTGPLADSLGLPVGEVAATLRLAEADGYARRRTGERVGWSLTAEGRKENERLLADEADELPGRRAAIDGAYRRFLGLNGEMLAACTHWQVIDPDRGVLNDHLDADHDRAVIDRLVVIDRSVQPICADLAGVLDRFGGYGPRFANALARIRAGEIEWFTRPTIDSYHTVWFELHEDLLATLGFDRASEHP